MVWALFALGVCNAQPPTEVRVARAVLDGKWALLDAQGHPLTDHLYDYISDFQGPYAIVQADGLEGVIDFNGRIRLHPKFEVVEFFATEGNIPADGMVRVMHDDKWGVASAASGQVRVPAVYANVENYHHGKVFVNKGGRWAPSEHGEAFSGGLWGLADTNGRELLTPGLSEIECFNRGYAFALKAGLWGVINAHGQFVVKPEYEQINEVASTIAAPEQRILQISKAGLIGWLRIGIAADYIVEPQYEHVRWPEAGPGLIAVQKNGLWGFVDLEGKVVVPFELQSTTGFQFGRAVAQLQGKYGTIGPTGQWLVPAEHIGVAEVGPHVVYCSAQVQAVGRALGPWVAIRTEDKWGIYNIDGRQAIPPRFDYAEPLFGNVIKVQEDERWGLYDAASGQPLLAIHFGDIKTVDEGMAGVSEGGQWRLVDAAGRFVNSAAYDAVEYFGFGLLQCRQAGKVGLIRNDGTVAADIKYAELSTLEDEYILLSVNGKTSLADTTGKLFQHKIFDEVLPPSFGVVPVRAGQSWGLMNLKGEHVLAMGFPTLPEAVAHNRFRAEEAAGFHLYDFNGRKLTSAPFSSIGYFVNNVAIVGQNGKYGLLKMDGTLATPLTFDSIEAFDRIRP